MNTTRAASAAIAAVAFALAGCSSTPAVNTGSVGPASGSAPAASSAAPSTPTWGQRYTWPSGVAVEIANPAPCKPSSSAAPANIARAVLLRMTVVNGSQKPFDVGLLSAPTVQFASANATQITDLGGPCGNGGMETATVLPGKTYSFAIAYSVTTGQGDMQVELQPDFGSDKAVFVGKA